jgi:hypothetical protein
LFKEIFSQFTYNILIRKALNINCKANKIDETLNALPAVFTIVEKCIIKPIALMAINVI